MASKKRKYLKQSERTTVCDTLGYPYLKAFDMRSSLEPLICQIAEYDKLRVKLENEGGNISDLGEISKVLDRPVNITGHFRTHSVQLTEQDDLRSALDDVHYGLYFDIRLLETQMPVYYLCRVQNDYWGEYSLIIEDLYVSPGYRFKDERFAKLMSGGHELYFLRLSQFREKVTALADADDNAKQTLADSLLYDVGRYVLQAAWHEDQSLAIMVAKHLGLPIFNRTVELIYLCLSGDLCELRGAINKPLLHFFEEIYCQPVIVALLKRLSTVDGGALNQLPQQALGLYTRLLRAFGEFLSEEVWWGYQKLKMPLWKVLYANFSRMDLVAGALQGDRGFKRAGKKLEESSRQIISEITHS